MMFGDLSSEDERGGVERELRQGVQSSSPRVEVDGASIAQVRNYFFTSDVIAEVCRELGVQYRVSAFARLDLFDEYRLMIHPVVLGNGIPLFQELTRQRTLKLRRTCTFPSGVVLLHYDRDRAV